MEGNLESVDCGCCVSGGTDLVVSMSAEQSQRRIINRLRADLAKERAKSARALDELRWVRQRIHEIGGFAMLERRATPRPVRRTATLGTLWNEAMRP